MWDIEEILHSMIFLYVYGEQGNALGIKKQEYKSKELPGRKNEAIYAQ